MAWSKEGGDTYGGVRQEPSRGSQIDRGHTQRGEIARWQYKTEQIRSAAVYSLLIFAISLWSMLWLYA